MAALVDILSSMPTALVTDESIGFPLMKAGVMTFALGLCAIVTTAASAGDTNQCPRRPLHVHQGYVRISDHALYNRRGYRNETARSNRACAVLCLRDDACKSFTFCPDDRRCELNTGQFREANSGDWPLSDSGCIHFDEVVKIASVCKNETTLGIEDGTIPDYSITASSYWNSMAFYSPPMARLNNQDFAAAWCSAGVIDPNPWIQVDFNTKVYITALITQGRGDPLFPQWVTEYQVSTSDDGQIWEHVTNPDCPEAPFMGNSDQTSLVTTRFRKAMFNRFIRILPTKWYDHCSMRFEVVGCF